MVDIEYGKESDSEGEEEYCLEDENTIDNPVYNASSGNVVILDPSPEQSLTPGVGVIVVERQGLPQPVLHGHIVLKSVFRLPLLNKK